ncbi:MAG: VOC family protein [Acidimicrobiaceae bacterium]|nr:VOC family protein [Chromatiales bacterium]MYC52189.1 VOC family protein [Gammaproteobacteria bacterium]MYI37167.1 VOC family protein [Acidimicrobiaceae bacterium]
MYAKIDHVIWAAPSLDDACRQFESLTGVSPVYGGQHTDGDTHNAVIGLGDRRYLEILAAKPDTKTADPWALYCRALPEPRLFTYAMRPPLPIDEFHQYLVESGLSNDDVTKGGRRTPDGRILDWRYCGARANGHGGLVPFFIEWDRGHATESLVVKIATEDFSLRSPDPQGLSQHLERMKIKQTVEFSEKPGLDLALSTPKGSVHLS